MADKTVEEMRELWNPDTVCLEATLQGLSETEVQALEHLCHRIYTGPDEQVVFLDSMDVSPVDIM